MQNLVASSSTMYAYVGGPRRFGGCWDPLVMGHVRPLETLPSPRPSPRVTVLNLVILGQTVREYLTEIRRKNLAP